MQKMDLWRRFTSGVTLGVLAVILSACTATTVELPPEPPEILSLPKPLPEPVAEPPALPAEPAPMAAGDVSIDVEPASRKFEEHVAVVLSSSLPAYVNVASRLAESLGNYDVYDMTDKSRTPQQAFSAIADSHAKFIVAIGLHAANVAKSFAMVPVVFSQVFNVDEHNLLADEFKGIAVLPPMRLQVDAWVRLDPGLQSIGAIVGSGHEKLIAEAEVAMLEKGIEFRYEIANSDRETIYHFNRLIREIDGFLLFPDNRILSRTALTTILEEAARHQVQVAVFNDALLDHGATLSVNSVADDVAARTLDALRAFRAGEFGSVLPQTPLTQIRVETNPDIARKLGLQIDKAFGIETLADATE